MTTGECPALPRSRRNYCKSNAGRSIRRAACRALYLSGNTHLAIARALGISRPTVTYYLGPRCKA